MSHECSLNLQFSPTSLPQPQTGPLKLSRDKLAALTAKVSGQIREEKAGNSSNASSEGLEWMPPSRLVPVLSHTSGQIPKSQLEQLPSVVPVKMSSGDQTQPRQPAHSQSQPIQSRHSTTGQPPALAGQRGTPHPQQSQQERGASFQTTRQQPASPQAPGQMQSQVFRQPRSQTPQLQQRQPQAKPQPVLQPAFKSPVQPVQQVPPAQQSQRSPKQNEFALQQLQKLQQQLQQTPAQPQQGATQTVPQAAEILPAGGDAEKKDAGPSQTKIDKPEQEKVAKGKVTGQAKVPKKKTVPQPKRKKVPNKKPTGTKADIEPKKTPVSVPLDQPDYIDVTGSSMHPP